MLPFPTRLIICLLAVVAFCMGTLTPTDAPGQAKQPAPLPNTLAVLSGHEDTIYAIAFQKDGKTVVTGSFDKTVRVWDATTGKQLRVYGGQAGHQNLVLTVDLSPDGQSILSGGSDNTARVWDVPMLTPLRELALPQPLTTAAASPDNKQVAVGLSPGVVKVFASNESKELFALNLPSGSAVSPTGLVYSPNSQWLVVAGRDGQLTFAQAQANGKLTGTYGTSGQPLTSAVIHPNGQALYVGGADGRVRFWKFPPAPPRALPSINDTLTSVTFGASGTLLVSGGTDKVVRLHSTQDGSLQKQLPAMASEIRGLALSPDNKLVAVGSADGRLTLWNVSEAKIIANPLVHEGGVTGVDYQTQGGQIATVGGDGYLRLAQLPPLPTRTLQHPEAVRLFALTEDSKRLLSVAADKVVRVWKVGEPTAQIERQLPGLPQPITSLAIQADILALGDSEGIVRLWQTKQAKELAQLTGHVGPVVGLAFLNNGQQLLSAGEDGTLRLWQLPAVAAKALVHSQAVTRAVLSPDGKRVISAANDKQVRLWNIDTAQPEKTHGSEAAVAALAVAPDNASVAIAGEDQSLVVLVGGKEAKRFPNLPAVARALAFTPDSNSLIAGLADNSIRIYSIADGKEIRNIAGHGGAINSVTITPKGDLLSASADQTVRLWNPSDGAAKGQFKLGGPIIGVSLTRDSSKLASASGKTVQLLNLADGKVSTFTTPAEITSVAIHPDGQRLAVGGTDGRVRLYEPSGRLIESFAHTGPVVALAYHPDGKRLVSASADQTVRVWSPAANWVSLQPSPARALILHPNQQRFYTAAADGQIRAFTTGDGKEQRAFAAHTGGVAHLSIRNDGTQLASVGEDKTAKVWQPDEGKLLTTVNLRESASQVALSPSGARLAVATQKANAPRVRVYEVSSGREMQTLTDFAGSVRALHYAADNRTIYVGGDDKLITLADTNVATAIVAHAGGANCVSFHPNGAQLFTGGQDKTARYWSLGDAKQLKQFGPFDAPVRAIAVSKDSQVIAIAEGKNVRVRQIGDDKELALLTHPDEVQSVAFSPDSTKLLTGCNDKVARVWDVAKQVVWQSVQTANPVRAVAYHPSANLFTTSGEGKSAALVSLEVTAVVAVGAPVRALELTPNGSHVLVGGDGKLVKMLNTANGNEERTFAGSESTVSALAVNKNGQLLAVGNSEGKIHLHNLANSEIVGTILAGGAVERLTFHPSLPVLVGATKAKTVAVWNIAFQPGQPLPSEFGQVVQQFSHSEAVEAMALSPDGVQIYAGGAEKSLRVWRLAANTPTKSLPHPNIVDAVAYSPDGKLVASACHDGQVRIWDHSKAAVVKAINAHIRTQPKQEAFPVYTVAWSPDGKYVASGSRDRSVKIWDAASGNLHKEFKAYHEKDHPDGHTDAVTSITFTPNSQFLLSAGEDRSIRVWDVATGKLVRQFINPKIKQPDTKPSDPKQKDPKADPKADPKLQPIKLPPTAHPGTIHVVRVSPDGKQVISGGVGVGRSGYLAVWDLEGRLQEAYDVPNGWVYGVAISPDNQRAAVACGPRDRIRPSAQALILRLPGR